jgi:putative transposase
MGAKNKLASRLEITRPFVEPAQPLLSVRRQCQLRGLSRSGWSAQPGGDSPEQLALRRLLAEPYTRPPFSGVWRMTAGRKPQGYEGNAKRVRRRWRCMGLEASSPQPNLSRAATEHRISPDVLNAGVSDRVDQVWSADMSAIRLRRGVVSLVASSAGYSRDVIAGEVSVTWDRRVCLSALARA